jgi:hypothetical protein
LVFVQWINGHYLYAYISLILFQRTNRSKKERTDEWTDMENERQQRRPLLCCTGYWLHPQSYCPAYLARSRSTSYVV